MNYSIPEKQEPARVNWQQAANIAKASWTRNSRPSPPNDFTTGFGASHAQFLMAEEDSSKTNFATMGSYKLK